MPLHDLYDIVNQLPVEHSLPENLVCEREWKTDDDMKCLSCGSVTNSHFAFNGPDQKVHPGAIAICGSCGNSMMFVESRSKEGFVVFEQYNINELEDVQTRILIKDAQLKIRKFRQIQEQEKNKSAERTIDLLFEWSTILNSMLIDKALDPERVSDYRDRLQMVQMGVLESFIDDLGININFVNDSISKLFYSGYEIGMDKEKAQKIVVQIITMFEESQVSR